jgi:hypothetical protein
MTVIRHVAAFAAAGACALGFTKRSSGSAFDRGSLPFSASDNAR